jgi:hypothetical protein
LPLLELELGAMASWLELERYTLPKGAPRNVRLP